MICHRIDQPTLLLCVKTVCTICIYHCTLGDWNVRNRFHSGDTWRLMLTSDDDNDVPVLYIYLNCHCTCLFGWYCLEVELLHYVHVYALEQSDMWYPYFHLCMKCSLGNDFVVHVDFLNIVVDVFST